MRHGVTKDMSNCHEYCPVAEFCTKLTGADGMNPDECAMRYKIDDLLLDASSSDGGESDATEGF